MKIPFTITGQAITTFFRGRMYNVPLTDKRFQGLKDHLKLEEHDEDTLEGILDVQAKIVRETHGLVKVFENEVTYKGEAVHGVLIDKLLSLLAQGFDVKPWVRFLDNMMKNPSYKSRQSLFNFLEKFNAPITGDGHFLAFKMVRRDYMDSHTGTLDNSIGKVVTMPRENVDDDSNVSCSSGLHVCASEYLEGYSFGPITVVVKVNPRDVVAVPTDYNFSKMRVCQYEVVADITREAVKDLEDLDVVSMYDDVDDDYYEDDWDDEDDYAEDDDHDDGVQEDWDENDVQEDWGDTGTTNLYWTLSN